jgi:hypothetical protein
MAQEPDAGIDLDVGADASRTVGDLGPNDAADWGAANYFSGTYNFWSNRSAPARESRPIGVAGGDVGSCRPLG